MTSYEGFYKLEHSEQKLVWFGFRPSKPLILWSVDYGINISRNPVCITGYSFNKRL